MLMMQQLQPEMKKLQSKYKDDRQKLNEELLKFYKENNINPVGGCLPLLVQTPVFLVLYSVLRGLTLRVPVDGHRTSGRVTGQHLPRPVGDDAAARRAPVRAGVPAARQHALPEPPRLHRDARRSASTCRSRRREVVQHERRRRRSRTCC